LTFLRNIAHVPILRRSASLRRGASLHDASKGRITSIPFEVAFSLTERRFLTVLRT
jgi:hypothetical protein